MMIEPIILTIVALAFTVASFIIGRQTAAKSEATRLAIMESNIEHILKSLEDIKASLKEESIKRSESIGRLRDKIDKHEEIFHKGQT